MRNLLSPLLLVLALTGQIFAQGNSDPITTFSSIPTQVATTTVGTPAIDLRNFFAVPTITNPNQILQFSTSKGTFNVMLDSSVAPITVANFLSYVNASRFTNSIVHRLDKSLGVIQGGGFYNRTDPNSLLVPVARNTDAAIDLEAADTMLNARGTLAMANSGVPNSTTSQWFINTADNRINLPPASSNGYAAFGRVTGTGMTAVVDVIATLPTATGTLSVTNSTQGTALVSVDHNTLPANFGVGWGLLGTSVANYTTNTNFVTLSQGATATINAGTATWSRFGPPFLQLPLLAALPADNSVQTTNLIVVNSIATVPLFPATAGGAAVATFSVTQNTNSALVATSVIGSSLYVSAASNLTGSADITVTAKDTNGNAVPQTFFTVNVTRKVTDFNGDGKPDILFQNNAGQIYSWSMNTNATVAASAFISTAGLGTWKLKAVADMNNDGVPDFIFQNSTGQVYLWRMNANGTIASSAYIYSGGLGDWRLAGAVDMNHDGTPDLLFQNNVGQISLWLMNPNGTIGATGYFFGGGLGDWKLAVVADLNSDGNADLIFQNNAGQIYAWLLDSAGNVTNAGYLYTGGLGDWRLVSTADIDGDGKADLIFQNNVGQISAWYMNGAAGIKTTGYIYAGGLGDWRVR